MNRLMAMVLPCKEVVEAASSDGLSAQPWWRKPLFAMHLAGCGFCSRFARQMEMIRRVLADGFRAPKDVDHTPLEKRILALIRRP